MPMLFFKDPIKKWWVVLVVSWIILVQFFSIGQLGYVFDFPSTLIDITLWVMPSNSNHVVILLKFREREKTKQRNLGLCESHLELCESHRTSSTVQGSFTLSAPPRGVGTGNGKKDYN